MDDAGQAVQTALGRRLRIYYHENDAFMENSGPAWTRWQYHSERRLRRHHLGSKAES